VLDYSSAFKSNALSFIKKIVPVVISLSIIYYYFHNQNWIQLFTITRKVKLINAIMATALPQITFWIFEVLITERHLIWFHGKFSFKDFLWVRGAIYLLVMINTSLGFGGVCVYIWKKSKISWIKLSGIMVFRYLLTIWGLTILMILTIIFLYFYGEFEKMGIKILILGPIMFSLFAWMIDTWFFWHNDRHFGLTRLIVKNPENEFWTAFRNASLKQWILTWIISICPFIIYLIGIYFQLISFNVHIPFFKFILYSPLAMVVSDIPISFAGFGTTTISFIKFFGSYGTYKSVYAFSLFFPLTRAITRSFIGLISLKFAMKDINTLVKQ